MIERLGNVKNCTIDLVSPKAGQKFTSLKVLQSHFKEQNANIYEIEKETKL